MISHPTEAGLSGEGSVERRHRLGVSYRNTIFLIRIEEGVLTAELHPVSLHAHYRISAGR